MTVLDELLIKFGADTADLKRELAQIESHTGRAARAMEASLGRVEGAVRTLGLAIPALTAAGLAQFTRESLTMAARLGDTAQMLGVNVERLQEYRFAASQAGASTEDMDRALTRFSVLLGDAQRGVEEAQSKLARIGVAWTDQAGRVRTTDAAWRDFADRMAKIQDPAKAASTLADALGDKFGPRLANALRQGAAGFDESGETLRRWGAVVSAETAQAANDFDNFFSRVLTGMKAWAANMAAASPGAAEQAFKPYVDYLGRLWTIYSRFIGQPFADVMGNRGLPGPRTEGGGGSFPPGIAPPLVGVPPPEPEETPPPPRDPKLVRQQAEALADAEKMAAQDATEFWDAFNKFLIAQEEKRIAFKQQYAEGIAAQEEDSARVAAEAWEAFNDQQGRLGEEIQRIWDETRTPAERYAERIERLNQLVQQGAIDWDTYARAVRKAQDELEDTSKKTEKLDDTARSLGFTFQSAFEDAVFAGKGLRDVLAGILQDIAQIIIRKGISEPAADAIGGAIKGLFELFGGGGGAVDTHYLGFAEGGRPPIGKPSVVGERGPELFVPDVAGTVVPNGKMMDSTTVHQSIHLHGVTVQSVRAEIMRAMPAIQQQTVAAVADARQRGKIPA